MKLVSIPNYLLVLTAETVSQQISHVPSLQATVNTRKSENDSLCDLVTDH